MSADLTRAKWDALGEKMVQAHFAVYTFTVIMAGILLVINLYGLSIYLSSPKEQREGRTAYIAVGFAMAIVFGLASSLDMSAMFRHIWETPQSSGYEYLMIANRGDGKWYRLVVLACYNVLVLISHGLVFYRCYILWSDHKWILVIPGLGYLGAVALGIMDATRLLGREWSDDKRNIIASAFTFSIRALDIVLSGLIIYRLFVSRKSLSAAFSGKHLRKYDQIMVLFVEAALITALLGIVDGVHLLLPSSAYRRVENLNFSYIVIETLYYLSMVFIPQIIIFRVTIGRTYRNSVEVRSLATESWTDTRSAPLDHTLRFAHTQRSDSMVSCP